MPHFSRLLMPLAVCGLWAFTASYLFAADASGEQDFVEIFNGKDLSGWVAEGTRTFRDGDDESPVWTAEEGEIHCAGRGFGFLRYDRKVADFILELEFRLNRGVNSGVGIRHVKYTGERKSRPSYAGYEIQLLDDAGKKPTDSSTGSLYRYVAAKANAVKPANEWNAMAIECRGSHIRITLNGETLHDLDQQSVPEIADKPVEGYFSLQNHGGKVAFRKLRLKELKELK